MLNFLQKASFALFENCIRPERIDMEKRQM